MKKIKIIISFMLISFFVAGCVPSKAEIASQQVPYEDQIKSVQEAIETFRKDTNGLLPIKTKEQETPIYEKYLIDFTKLTPKYLAEAPINAFESGGVYQYVIVDPEENPTVKLIDLRTAEVVSELQLRLQTYKERHTYPPYQDVVGEGVFTVDFQKLGYSTPPALPSPYSQNKLSFVIDTNGKMYIDYREDLEKAVQQKRGMVKEGEDIRYLLVEDSVFVPAFSLPYTFQDGKITFFSEK